MFFRRIFALLSVIFMVSSGLPGAAETDTLLRAADFTLLYDAPTATIFIPGGSYNGKEKFQKRNVSFTHNLLYRLHRLFTNTNTRYRTSKKSRRFLGIIRNSIYSLKYGNAVVPLDRMKKGKHRAFGKTLTETTLFTNISCDAAAHEPLNLVGSSYGSIVVAQIAVKIIEEYDKPVNSVLLLASPLDAESALGQKLKTYHAQGKIKHLLYNNTPGDNISGASGSISLWRLIFPRSSSGDLSVLNPHHPHNLAAKDIARSQEVIRQTLQQRNTEPLIDPALIQRELDAAQ